MSKEATPQTLEIQELDKKVCIRARVPWDCNSITRETIGRYLKKQGFTRIGNIMTWLRVVDQPDLFIRRLRRKALDIGILCQFRTPLPGEGTFTQPFANFEEAIEDGEKR